MSVVEERPPTRIASPLGERVRPVDWQAKTAGRAEYTDDVELPGTLVARVLRSPHPHAEVVSIGTDAVLRAPGVAAVITASDLPDVPYIHHGGPLSDRPVLARGVVRFVGQEVAAVAAETPAQADEALRRFEVRYRPLSAVTTMVEAREPGAPKIHPHTESGNISLSIARSWGDSEASGRAQVRVQGAYRFNRQTHVCMETNSVLASWDPQAEQLEIWVSSQAPYFIRKELANVLGLELSQVIVHEVAVGGGFGSKSKISEHEAIAGALSMKASRPVRLVLSRDEEFATTKCRHDFEIGLETGADAEGNLTHRSARIAVDNGAYNHSGPSVMGYGTLTMGSLYRTGGVDLHADLIYTNKQPGGQFRGYGGPQATFAIESQMDELAEQLGRDPLELRMQNANRPGDVTHTGWQLGSARLVECLERAAAESDWFAKRKLGGSGRGIGVAASIHVTGAHVYENAERSSAAVDVGPDGRVTVRFGGADAGTGQRTVLAQIAATELGVALADVDVVMMESAITPEDMGAWSSRGTFMSGHAVAGAARRVAERARELAAAELGGDATDVKLAGGAVITNGSHLSLSDVVRASGEERLSFTEEFVADIEPVDPRTGVSNLSGAYSFAAQVVEVEVDRQTGQVRLLDVVAVHDCGRVLNPVAAESQIVGGVAMGLGAALGEELVTEQGRLANGSYIDYALPRAADLPRIRVIFLDAEEPAGPYGAKGIGEIGLIPTPAAVANAVTHASGIRVRELPITPDKIVRRAGRRRGNIRRSYRIWRRPNRWWIAGVRAAYPRGLETALHRYGTRLARKKKNTEIRRRLEPHGVGEATAALSESATVAIGGGTDLLPARRQGVAPAADALVDLTEVEELKALCEDEHGALRIGGGVHLAELVRRPELVGKVLAETAARIASPQIREMATVGGNLCQQKRCWFYRSGFQCYKRGGATCPCYAVNGDHRFYHAAMGAHRCQAVTPSDLATTLLALDADIVIAGPRSQRVRPVSRFFTGPGETALQRGDLVMEVRVPPGARRRTSRFEKLRLWEGDFAVVSACASLAVRDAGPIEDARVVVGAVAPTALRLEDVERQLVGRRPDQLDLAAVARSWTWRGHPLPGNEWKLDAAAALVSRAIEGCLAERSEYAARGGTT
jgi:CO/xanthine dehydrogenase Mo-binding subunit/CO/xanthine dehydrogenase FAD-binding subunit